LTKLNKKNVVSCLKKGFCTFLGMFLNLVVIIYFNYIFHVNIQLFVTLMSDQDPDPEPHGSKLVRINNIGISH
jgi:hypothetical protein